MSLIHYLFTIYTDSAWRHVSDKLLACIDWVGSCNVMVSPGVSRLQTNSRDGGTRPAVVVAGPGSGWLV